LLVSPLLVIDGWAVFLWSLDRSSPVRQVYSIVSFTLPLTNVLCLPSIHSEGLGSLIYLAQNRASIEVESPPVNNHIQPAINQ